MKIYQLQKLKKGIPTVVKFGAKEWAHREPLELFRCIQMKNNPLTPYRLVENNGGKITNGNWQTQFSEDENKMLNCDHEKSVVCGYESCQKCKWSELTALAGMYNIEELNR
jgi:hypothetical protein